MERPARPDPALIRAVAKAFVWNRKLVLGDVRSTVEIAEAEGVTPRYVRKILPLAHLAPDIVEEILAGRQSRTMSLRSLVDGTIPRDWNAQRDVLG